MRRRAKQNYDNILKLNLSISHWHKRRPVSMRVPKTRRRRLSSIYVFCMMDVKKETPTTLVSHEPGVEKELVDGEETRGREVAMEGGERKDRRLRYMLVEPGVSEYTYCTN